MITVTLWADYDRNCQLCSGLLFCRQNAVGTLCSDSERSELSERSDSKPSELSEQSVLPASVASRQNKDSMSFTFHSAHCPSAVTDTVTDSHRPVQFVNENAMVKRFSRLIHAAVNASVDLARRGLQAQRTTADSHFHSAWLKTPRAIAAQPDGLQRQTRALSAPTRTPPHA